MSTEPTGSGAQDLHAKAREVCLRLLTGQARSRAQLATALRRHQIPDEVAESVLDRLGEVGLVDDAAFANAWVSSRHAGRGLARRALAEELRRRGVAADTVERAVAEVDSDDEEAAARELVRRRLSGTRGRDTATRMRRLTGLLARRGYGAALAYRIVRAELEAEGAELDFPDPESD